MGKKLRKRLPLWEKLWKSIIALSIFFAFISPSGLTFELHWVIASIGIVVLLTAYWHLWEWATEFTRDVRTYLIALQRDVKFIKKAVTMKQNMNRKGSFTKTVVQIGGAVILLLLLWLLMKALFLGG